MNASSIISTRWRSRRKSSCDTLRLVRFLAFLLALPLLAQSDQPTADWVLQYGGRVRLPNSSEWISDPSGLPKGAFRLEGVDLVGTIIDHRDLGKLSPCTELRELILPGTIFNPGAGSTLDAAASVCPLRSSMTCA